MGRDLKLCVGKGTNEVGNKCERGENRLDPRKKVLPFLIKKFSFLKTVFDKIERTGGLVRVLGEDGRQELMSVGDTY